VAVDCKKTDTQGSRLSSMRHVPSVWRPEPFRGFADKTHIQTLTTQTRGCWQRRTCLKRQGERIWIAPRPASNFGLVRPFSCTSRAYLTKDHAPTAVTSGIQHEHAVISTFDLFSVGIGPSSSHTVGPMRAANIFLTDLLDSSVLQKVCKVHVSIYGSLALTGEGHMTPSALLLGLEGADAEVVEPDYVPARFEEIKTSKKLFLGRELPNGLISGKEIDFDYEHDFKWQFGKRLKLHSNGMQFMAFDKEGDILATKQLFSIGGGFVISLPSEDSPTIPSKAKTDRRQVPSLSEHTGNTELNPTDEKLRAKPGEDKSVSTSPVSSGLAHSPIITGQATADGTTALTMAGDQPQPRYPFRNAAGLLSLCYKHNLTIAQLVYENERSYGYTDREILNKIFRLWEVMDGSILEGVQAPSNSVLPGRLKLHRRAPSLYKRLAKGLYSSHIQSDRPKSNPVADSTYQSPISKPIWGEKSGTALLQQAHGSHFHTISPCPARRTAFPVMDHLSVYAIAVNETNASGGRIVTAPTNGAAGIIPSVLKYLVEFISDNPARDIPTFLLTASAIGMLFKRGATISAAEGGCMAEVGVACSMAAGAFAACMGAMPEVIEQAAEIGIEHNLGLTCDPIEGLVQAPCIERNALGAVKAISSANLALTNTGIPKVRLDDAIHAMRLTAEGMRHEFKETSLSGLATSVPIQVPVSIPNC
jgi:L-serine deaminase